jgi:ABC-type uncharacterized transport system substrate-binding protein
VTETSLVSKGNIAMFRKYVYRCFIIAACLVLSLFVSRSYAAAYRVLVIMSYHQEMPWENDIRQGIQAELGDSCEIRYIYLNAKNDPAGGPARAGEAWRVFQEFRPDGVIAADDDAQSLFVVPYLKDRVSAPVVFCGVNADPAGYGYPASNVTGIVERAHFRESISFLQQMVPGVRSFGFLSNANQTGRGYAEQIRLESGSYPITAHSVRLVKTIDEAVAAVEDMKKNRDALFLIAMEGLTARDGRPLSEKESFRVLTRAFGKPVIGMNEFNIRFGLLCAVVKTGREQGSVAARMLLKILRGTPVSAIPITRNQQGKRVLNVTVMKAMGIRPRPVLLVGAELVQTEE